MEKFIPFSEKAYSRRRFLAGASSVAAATTLIGCGDDDDNHSQSSTQISDTDVLNFALNLEYLEAEFYLRAATGSGLSSTDTGSASTTVTVASSTKLTGLTAFQQAFVNEIAYSEQEHVRFLRKTITSLGGTPVSRPSLDLMTSFNALASAAGVGSTFNPFANFDSFGIAAALFEDVGVTAYLGAAPLISAQGVAKGVLTAAAGIMAKEAYHAATLRGLVTMNAFLLGTTAYPYLTYANKLETLAAQLSASSSSGSTSAYGSTALTVPSGSIGGTSIVTPSTVVAADSNAVAYHRSTDQVLHIVYGTFTPSGNTTTTPAAGVSKGGFFPNGLNGTITTTQS